jgi:hypothetical protein
VQNKFHILTFTESMCKVQIYLLQVIKVIFLSMSFGVLLCIDIPSLSFFLTIICKLCCDYNYFLNDLFKKLIDAEFLQNIINLGFGVLDGCMLFVPPSCFVTI